MGAAKIKKGDNVVVRSGKDKGRSGTVMQVMPKDGKVLVQGVNVAARHRKPSQANPQGGIDRREAQPGSCTERENLLFRCKGRSLKRPKPRGREYRSGAQGRSSP